MSPLKISFLSALVAAAITAGSFYVLHRNRTAQVAELRQANQRMHAMLDQHRSNVAAVALAGAKEEASGARPATSAGGAPPTDAPSPARDYRNEGNSTPIATLQTFAWACDRGDAEMVAKLLVFEGPSRAKAEAFVAALPADVRGQWRGPEELAAALLTAENMSHPFPHARILENAAVETISDGRVMLRLPDTPKDRTQYQQTPDGWKYLITEAEVDAYIARATRPPSG